MADAHFNESNTNFSYKQPLDCINLTVYVSTSFDQHFFPALSTLPMQSAPPHPTPLTWKSAAESYNKIGYLKSRKEKGSCDTSKIAAAFTETFQWPFNTKMSNTALISWQNTCFISLSVLPLPSPLFLFFSQAEPLWTDPGPRTGTGVFEQISIKKKI